MATAVERHWSNGATIGKRVRHARQAVRTESAHPMKPADRPCDIVALLARIVAVGAETARGVESLPAIDFGGAEL